MKEIALSIIIPVYNAKHYLSQCIKSIISSTRDDLEIVIVDDGSKDGSATICDAFEQKDKRIKVYHQPNGGVSSARNLGIEQSNGKWIVFVDADDNAAKSLIEYQAQDKDSLICFNWEYTTGEKENEILTNATYSGMNKKNFLDKHLVDYIFRTPWAKHFRRDIIQKYDIRFNENYRIGEDNLFVLEYLNYCNTITTISDIGYIYLRPSKSKYILTIENAHQYINQFYSKYKKLQVCCPQLLQLLELYYFRALNDDSFKMRIQWEKSSAVRSMQNEFIHLLGKREIINIYFRRFYSAIFSK